MSVHRESVLFEHLQLALGSVFGADGFAPSHVLLDDYDRQDCRALPRASYHLIT